jgi:hypothetical protein
MSLEQLILTLRLAAEATIFDEKCINVVSLSPSSHVVTFSCAICLFLFETEKTKLTIKKLLE